MELAAGDWQSWLNAIAATAEVRARALDGTSPLEQRRRQIGRRLLHRLVSQVSH